MMLDDGKVKDVTEVDERRIATAPKIQLLSFIGSIGWWRFSLIDMMEKILSLSKKDPRVDQGRQLKDVCGEYSRDICWIKAFARQI